MSFAAKKRFSLFMHPKIAFPLFSALPEVRATACEKSPQFSIVLHSLYLISFGFHYCAHQDHLFSPKRYSVHVVQQQLMEPQTN